MEHVTSRQNALAKRFRALAHDTRVTDELLLDGARLLDEALRSGIRVEVAVFDADAAAGRLALLAERCGAAGVRLVTVPGSLLAAMSPVRQASGVVALAHLGATPLDATLAGPGQLILILDGVQDPGNVGAVVRAAEGCGATAVIAGPGTADPFGWKALRGAMGSTFRLPVARTDSLSVAVAAARAQGLRIIATTPRDGTPLRRAALSSPAAILLGGEGPGLPADAIARADDLVTIEMRPPVESLNVAIAAALVLYEASRQRSHVAV